MTHGENEQARTTAVCPAVMVIVGGAVVAFGGFSRLGDVQNSEGLAEQFYRGRDNDFAGAKIAGYRPGRFQCYQ